MRVGEVRWSCTNFWSEACLNLDFVILVEDFTSGTSDLETISFKIGRVRGRKVFVVALGDLLVSYYRLVHRPI